MDEMSDAPALLFAVAVVFLYLIAVVIAVVQIAQSRALRAGERALWIIAVVLVPVIVIIAWYALGPRPFGIRIKLWRG